jgi:hypothetical protein
MEIIEYVEKLNNKFTGITKDYKYIYENIHNYINDGKVSYNQLMDFEVSLEDLSIQLNSLVFLFKQIQIESVVFLFNQKSNRINSKNNENNENNQNNTEIKVDYIVEKTIFNFMPLLFVYFMIYDKESILYAKDFIENKYDNKYDDNYDDNTKEFQYIIEPIDD